ncbi:MAG: hypothetical protein IJB55_01130 [Firmicutes bacterium]|nr:hypothetical protein [Bacillota bacterium]
MSFWELAAGGRLPEMGRLLRPATCTPKGYAEGCMTGHMTDWNGPDRQI